MDRGQLKDVVSVLAADPTQAVKDGRSNPTIKPEIDTVLDEDAAHPHTACRSPKMVARQPSGIVVSSNGRFYKLLAPQRLIRHKKSCPKEYHGGQLRVLVERIGSKPANDPTVAGRSIGQ